MHRFNRRVHLPVESAHILVHRLFLIFCEIKETEKGRLPQMESTLILSCYKKRFYSPVILNKLR